MMNLRIIIAFITIICLKAIHLSQAHDLPLSLSVRRGNRQRPPNEYDDNNGSDDNNEEEANRQGGGSKPLWSRMASESAKLSGNALSATARVSGKAAYNLVSPKHVEWRELVGLWRLDQWMNEEDRPIQSSIELKSRKTVVIKGSSRKENIVMPCQFTAPNWPRSARIEFEGPDKLIYSCSVDRKLADKSVLKLRGKIYEKRWGRKVLVGTFVGRRRLKLLLDDEEEEQEEEEEDRDEECDYSQDE
mmetsp:Transcript_12389/g.16262  ORF Transcript_12389/g.16262 Transcript_12389/m.16262 type:complete len:246 (+) Transcript_12389:34-771(+)